MSISSIKPYSKPPLLYSDSSNTNVNISQANIDNITGSYSPWLVPVRLATTAQIDLLNPIQIIDGVSINIGDRILVKNQIGNLDTLDGQLYNGIYIVDEIFRREPDLNVDTVPVGLTVYVAEGIQNGNTFTVVLKI